MCGIVVFGREGGFHGGIDRVTGECRGEQGVGGGKEERGGGRQAEQRRGKKSWGGTGGVFGSGWLIVALRATRAAVGRYGSVWAHGSAGAQLHTTRGSGSWLHQSHQTECGGRKNAEI